MLLLIALQIYRLLIIFLFINGTFNESNTVIQLFVTFVIKLTNSTSWATASREGLKALCFKELSQNNTFQESTEEKNGGSFVESIISVTCPSECHQRGICKNGKIANLLKVVTILMK